jgi:hypothetical protein
VPLAETEVYVFKFSLGIIVGLFSALMLVLVSAAFNVKIDISVVTNIVIAIATCAATYIHIDSVGRQRKIRSWEINKSILLDLVDTLSQTIDQVECVIQSFYTEEERVEDISLYKKLESQINHAINVYSTLMSPALISKIKIYKSELLRIESDFEQNCLDASDAYVDQLALSKNLYEELISFIAEIADVKVT